MRTSKLHLLVIAFLIGLSFATCKKTDSTDNSLKGNDVTATQDAESQDAQADNVDQSVDNIADALETNDFSAVKSTLAGGPSCSVDHPDTTTFPKRITLVFATDTTINGEKFKQTGTIVIYVERTKDKGPWKNYLKRSISISPNTPFKTENDSASFSVSGTRTMTRQSVSLTPPLTKDNILTVTNLRLDIIDSINSDLTFGVTCGDYSGSFTRKVKRTREVIAHYEKVAATKIWHQAFIKDTLKYTGSVSGINLQDSLYSRVITSPIIFTRCALLVPVISSGVLTVTRDGKNGTKTAIITYSKDACKTLVTIEVNGKTKEIERKLNRKYKKWWL